MEYGEKATKCECNPTKWEINIDTMRILLCKSYNFELYQQILNITSSSSVVMATSKQTSNVNTNSIIEKETAAAEVITVAGSFDQTLKSNKRTIDSSMNDDEAKRSRTEQVSADEDNFQTAVQQKENTAISNKFNQNRRRALLPNPSLSKSQPNLKVF
jgi:hypothetical protein